jgi:hypothetical protein
MWTKAHHVKIANAIRTAKTEHPDTPAPINYLQAELAKMFGTDGSEFSAREFELGCSPDQPQQRRTA